jgi:hypothetical protein
MNRSTRVCISACLGALALGCFGSYERAVEETRAGLIGKTGRELRACLGVPTDFDRDGEVEQLTYRWYSNPRIKNGGPVTGGIVIGQGGISAGGDTHDFPRDPEEQAYCQLDFSLNKTGVTKVTARGRDAVGLRADAECMLRARHCVDGDED